MILFLILLAIVVTVSFIVFAQTGPMGIEERFSQAVGLPFEGEHEDEGGSGISIEGNTILYAIILCILTIICVLAYKYGNI
ncbi:hypothetical protein EHM76_03385 [bacterium]|nr:MAG: hypothetical protein EHM76_03385 [bacterium]